MNVWVDMRSAALSALLLLSALPVLAQTPRSTRYDGSNNAYYRYAPDPAWDASLAMTIEAWVRREEPGRCETIAAAGYTQSWWFGFCGASPSGLRFYRSGGISADAGVALPAWRWAHVAAAYDGARVRFYLDGIEIAVRALANNGAGRVRELSLGADFSTGFPYALLGYLDEVRLWSVARTGEQIRAGMYQELRDHPDLVAAFGMGGGLEDLADAAGVAGAGVSTQVLGILPLALRVPRSLLPMQLDGIPDIAGEYLNAELLVMPYRSGGSIYDAIFNLVYNDAGLWIGCSSLNNSFDRPSPKLDVLLDPDFSREALAVATDHALRVDMFSLTESWLVGDGAGGFVPCTVGAPPVPCPMQWDTRANYCAGEFSPPCIEYRIDKLLLGEYTETDGFAIAHFDANGPQDYFAPADAIYNSPATWAPLTYGPASVVPPTVQVSGWVVDDTFGGGAPIPGIQVNLVNGQSFSLVASSLTDAQGRFSINSVAPPNVPLWVQYNLCSSCNPLPPTFGGGGTAPTGTHGPTTAVYPPCVEGGSCTLASVTFRVERPPSAPIVLTTANPTTGSPSIQVRGGPNPKSTAATEVTINGSNIHRNINVWLYRSQSCIVFPDLCDRLPVEIVDRAANGSWVRVRVPKPDGPNTGNWFWVVEDLYLTGSSRFVAGPSLKMTYPEYPLVHGYTFKNEADSASFHEFLAVFGSNAMICIGAKIPFTDICLGCRIPDPIYLIYYPIYWGILNSTDGSCVGMSATSLRFYYGNLDYADMPEGTDVLAANGFAGGGPGELLAPKPADFDGGVCFPAEADNLWAQIRRHHGAQLSDEFVREVIQRVDLTGSFSVVGDPKARLLEIRDYPTRYLLSMLPSGGGGHCVVPYAVDMTSNPAKIKIYDNNDPNSTSQVVEVDTVNNTWSYPSRSWSGTGLVAVPINVYEQSLHMPGLGSIGDFIWYIVLGSADGLYETQEGERWGWDADGNYIDDMGGLALPPLNTEIGETRNVMLIRPSYAQQPHVQVNCRGGDFVFHTAQLGNVLQLEGLSRPAAAQDSIRLVSAEGQLCGFGYVPGDASALVLPRIGSVLGEECSVVFRWTGLEVPVDGEVGFDTPPGAPGRVRFHNRSGVPLAPALHIDFADGPNAATRSVILPPAAVPDGAVVSDSLVNWPTQSVVLRATDLNADGVPERTTPIQPLACEVAPGSPGDCNRNGVLDACDIAMGTSRDEDLDGYPDECFVIVPPTCTPLPGDSPTPTPTRTPTRTPTPSPTLPPGAEWLWGDVDGNGIVGTLDASLVLQWDALVIDRFPCCPGVVWPSYPQRADTSGNGVLGSVDASLILQYDAFLIGCLLADTNCDRYGPE